MFPESSSQKPEVRGQKWVISNLELIINPALPLTSGYWLLATALKTEVPLHPLLEKRHPVESHGNQKDFPLAISDFRPRTSDCYFNSINLSVFTNDPALIRQKYSPVATFCPRLFVPSQKISCRPEAVCSSRSVLILIPCML